MSLGSVLMQTRRPGTSGQVALDESAIIGTGVIKPMLPERRHDDWLDLASRDPRHGSEDRLMLAGADLAT